MLPFSVICVRVSERGSKGGREGMWEEKREGERDRELHRLFTYSQYFGSLLDGKDFLSVLIF